MSFYQATGEATKTYVNVSLIESVRVVEAPVGKRYELIAKTTSGNEYCIASSEDLRAIKHELYEIIYGI